MSSAWTIVPIACGDGDMVTLPPAKNLSTGIVAPSRNVRGLDMYGHAVELAVDEENTVSLPSGPTTTS